MDTPTPTLVAGPSVWFENARDAAGADVAGRFARDPYNARAVTPAVAAGLSAARDADIRQRTIHRVVEAWFEKKRREDSRVAEAVRAVAIDRELHADFAARLDGIASHINMAKLEAIGLSWDAHAATLADIQSFLETMAGEIRVKIGDFA